VVHRFEVGVDLLVRIFGHISFEPILKLRPLIIDAFQLLADLPLLHFQVNNLGFKFRDLGLARGGSV
jgi:hypothetical protein